MMTPTLDYVYIKVNVQNPQKEPCCSSYMTYEITLETNDPSFTLNISSTRRRYSDFRVLHNLLSKQFTFTKLPPLPPKSPFQNSFKPVFVEKRRQALEEFLIKLLSTRICLSSRALHLFLQTTIPIDTIKDIFDGKTPDIVPVKESEIMHDSVISKDFEVDEENDSQDNAHFEDASDTPLENSCLSQSIKKVSFCDQVTVAEIHVQ